MSRIETFKQKWEEHVAELNKLKWNLPIEKAPRINKCIDELREFIEEASRNLDKDPITFTPTSIKE
jgi:hypothetical protein